MAWESPDALQSEANEDRPRAETAEQHLDVHQHEQCDDTDAARSVRYLWPALSSLWQGE